MSQTAASTPPSLTVRTAVPADVAALSALSARVYGKGEGYTQEMLLGQQARFPQGQFVAEYDGCLVGFCATFRIDETLAMARHDWLTITGGGFASRHDPRGDWLYGMEICVDPEYRNLRIARRLYRRRRELCEVLKLKGIVFAGRLPGFARWQRRSGGEVDDYIDEVRGGSRRDSALSFQLRNGFEPIEIGRAHV